MSTCSRLAVVAAAGVCVAFAQPRGEQYEPPGNGLAAPVPTPWTAGNGIPAAWPGPGGPNLKRCMCRDGAQFDVCAAIDCASLPVRDSVCAPVCAEHAGQLATACYPSAAVCAAR
jgi:hypothetical protein